MSNMSYCRFRNTLGDLQDCYDWMVNNPDGVIEALTTAKGSEGTEENGREDELSDEEARALRDLVQLCADIAKECDPDA